MLAPRLHVAHGGPVSRGRGAISATDLKVDVERCGGLNICPFFVHLCVCVRAHVFGAIAQLVRECIWRMKTSGTLQD